MSVISKVLTSLALALLGTQANTVVDIVVNDTRTTTLETAVVRANLVGTLNEDGPYTVFAPSDQAFGQLELGFLSTLLVSTNMDLLVDLLTYHVVNGSKVMRDDLVAGEVTAVNGKALTIQVTSSVSIEGAGVSEADLDASNGVVHIIDTVLVPPMYTFPSRNIMATATGSPLITTLVQAVNAVNYGSALAGSGITVFAPTNAAFAALGDTNLANLLLPANAHILTAILEFHTMPSVVLTTDLTGQISTSNESFNVTPTNTPNVFILDGKSVTLPIANVHCTGSGTGKSYAHIIDTVILPSWFSVDLLQTSDPDPDTASTASGLARPLRTAVLFVGALVMACWSM